MGIRIHKVIGYGFLKCKYENDPRFNNHVFSRKGNLHEGDLRDKMIDYIEKNSHASEEGEWDEKNSDYRVELSALKCVGMWDNLKKERIDFDDVIRYNYYNTEKDLPIGPIVFTIPYHKDWYRFDDSIDYIEETQRRILEDVACNDRVKIITDCENQPDGIYPWNGSYVHRKTGERLRKLSCSDRWLVTRSLRESGTTDLKKNNEYGVKTLVEWQRYIVPKLPPFIEIFCDCFNIFKNPLTKYRLKPMVYSYWS